MNTNMSVVLDPRIEADKKETDIFLVQNGFPFDDLPDEYIGPRRREVALAYHRIYGGDLRTTVVRTLGIGVYDVLSEIPEQDSIRFRRVDFNK